MIQNILLRIAQAGTRLLRALSLLNPRRIVRHFQSVSQRLSAVTREVSSISHGVNSISQGVHSVTRYVNTKNASRFFRGLRTLAQCETRLIQLENRSEELAQHIQNLGLQISQLAEQQRSLIEELRSEIQRGFEDFDAFRLDRWRIDEIEGILRYLRCQDYLRAIREGRLAVPLIETDHPIAVSSNDTKFPRGSKNDNSISARFNRKLYELFRGAKPIRVLDIGCAGGGFVRSLLDDGHFAVGLDGSDYPFLNQTGEWATIPNHLFTCDVTKPFRLVDRATHQPILFDAITAWELMEHIPEEGLPRLFENLDRHLVPGGFLLLSIATFLDWDQPTGVVWHVTVKPRSWWEDRFDRLGFEVEEEHPFGKDDWLRGSGQCRLDWHEDDGLGFHIVLRRKTRSGLVAPTKEGWRASVA
jgi:SAM-dependent methyltransferase